MVTTYRWSSPRQPHSAVKGMIKSIDGQGPQHAQPDAPPFAHRAWAMPRSASSACSETANPSWQQHDGSSTDIGGEIRGQCLSCPKTVPANS